jgi:NADP-dependent 3-hydroxy acid dehydrogenase YdfG
MPPQRTIVITGASAGIGAALARHLGAAGHRLVLAARSRDKLEAVARESGREALAVVTDVTKRSDVDRLRDEAVRVFGNVDVWINNAGQGIDRHVLDLTDADLDEMMAVNVKSALYGIQAIVPHFIERGSGHLINISSFLGRVPLATNRSAYNAAKAALNALTANLRVDLSREHPGIRVSLVMPSVVTTDFAVNALGSRGPARMVGPMQPQTPEEVAAIIAALIEDPKAEILTNPAAPAIAKRYLEDVGGFEAEARRGRMSG